MIGVSERSLGTNEVVHIAQDLRRKMKNTVSVITVAYNAEKTIRKTIQSALVPENLWFYIIPPYGG